MIEVISNYVIFGTHTSGLILLDGVYQLRLRALE